MKVHGSLITCTPHQACQVDVMAQSIILSPVSTCSKDSSHLYCPRTVYYELRSDPIQGGELFRVSAGPLHSYPPLCPAELLSYVRPRPSSRP